jgi:hypothetical protein
MVSCPRCGRELTPVTADDHRCRDAFTPRVRYEPTPEEMGWLDELLEHHQASLIVWDTPLGHQLILLPERGRLIA